MNTLCAMLVLLAVSLGATDADAAACNTRLRSRRKCVQNPNCVWSGGRCQAVATTAPSAPPPPITPPKCTRTKNPFTSCAAIKAAFQDLVSEDGDYLLYYEGESTKPYPVYCEGMSSDSPVSYLNLNPSTNFARLACGGHYSGSDVTSRFSKVYFDTEHYGIPGTIGWSTHEARWKHTRFPEWNSETPWASTSGSCKTPEGFDMGAQALQFGTAASCKYSASGSSSIDLSGLPFTIPDGKDAFDVVGYQSKGVVEEVKAGVHYRLTGGGYCGWNKLSNQPSLPGTSLDFTGTPFGMQAIGEYDIVFPSTSYQTMCAEGECADWADLAGDGNSSPQAANDAYWKDSAVLASAGASCAIPAEHAKNNVGGRIPWCRCKNPLDKPNGGWAYCAPPSAEPPVSYGALLAYDDDATFDTAAFEGFNTLRVYDALMQTFVQDKLSLDNDE